MDHINRRVAVAAILLALLAAALAYWTGLGGSFILDDANNLDPIQAWLQGRDTWQHVLLDNGSGILGRPLSMATLMASAWLGGYTPFAFKFGNLVLHLACVVVGWCMLRRALALDAHLRQRAEIIAALLAAAWLLHPINVSTVLYAVQRMAQVSTLFTLAAIWAYLSARGRMTNAHDPRGAGVRLFVLFPLMTVLGLLGKENAAVAPALCLVFEIACFRTTAEVEDVRTRRTLALFYGLFLVVPAILAAAAFIASPGRFLGGYAIRDFTLSQRLLSESRALLDYIIALLLPFGAKLGVFNDDFAVSTGLMTPPSTALSLAILGAFTIGAIIVRKRAPSIFAGWFFFLVAHSIESSIFPLELYFEHRNYLPAFGLLLALAGVVEFASRPLRRQQAPRWKPALLACAAWIAALGVATHARAWVWADDGRLLEHEALQHPASVRATSQYAFYAIQHGKPHLAGALIDGLIDDPNPRVRELGLLNRVLADCVATGTARGGDLNKAVELALPRVTLEEMHVFSDLARVNEQRTCTAAGPVALADAAVAIVDAARDQPDSIQTKWSMRLTAASLYANGGNWKLALRQAELAWQPTADAPVGAFLVRAYAHNGLREQAEHTYDQVAARIDPDSTNDRNGLERLREFLDRYPQPADANPQVGHD